MFTYRVQYIANDGKPCAFKFKSETVLRNTFNCYCKLHLEMWEAAKKFMEDPDTTMSKHGGFDGWYGLRKITNLDTNHCVYFEKWEGLK